MLIGDVTQESLAAHQPQQSQHLANCFPIADSLSTLSVSWDDQGLVLFPIIFPVARVPAVRDNETAVAAQEQEAVVAPLMDTEKQRSTSSAPDFEALVEQHYRRMYQFAYNLTHDEAEACDLTQQTFLKWARKGHQLRDPSKAKTWLFTTLHREFLQARRKHARFPHHELDAVARELPTVPPAMFEHLDATTVLAALAQVNEPFRAPLALFYLDDYSYKEISEILDVPMGTVQSRIARGKSQLYKILTDNSPSRTAGAEKPHG